ncbi:MAG TPA: hypothetical protein VII12_12600 [Thermoanaerobaculia bacterium]
MKAIASAVEPKIQATVVTIQTTLQPQNKILSNSIVIGNGRARSDDEVDHWRLFDLEKNRVTYVDDVTRTYYTTRYSAASAAEDDAAPQFVPTDAKRVLQGVEATQYVVRLGAYQRELWIGNPPSIPEKLYGMMNASDDGLPKVRGFPLVDHSELPYGKSKLIVDRTVVKIENRDVPESLLLISSDYKEVTAPGARRPPASSPPPDRNTPAVE